ncbi:hypothetical protein SAMN00120144_4323 [Hymenobacter roseosalivarius DSM 11622]|uniref:Uncharacterized protein n=1 Tax=Hymenobacter roseosalivarius DSM 11622 TaxID=645990 RepID=A0A1W1W4Z5_9BACT|nr:hypothetical protein [Hymenobacter roseosalivarius]SMC00656.1 hypothetical protein SAMN00120144_4323 [Hymenobacter roseosalivarius DSM 11622]
MPRYPSFPSTANQLKRLELSYLLRSGLLRPGVRSTTLSWGNRGHPTGSISLQIHLLPGHETYLRLHYTANSKTKHDYRIELEAAASNLPGASAHRYYMICPVFGRRATVLFMRYDGLFVHRLAYGPQRLYYDSQLEPKRFRGLTKLFSVDRQCDKAYRPGRKLFYQGKPTRWHAALLKQEQQVAAAAPGLLQRLQR